MLDATASNPEQRPKRDSELASVPDHELLKKIGGGSYGEVWLARSVIGILRAVKVVRRATFERAEHFEREFRGLQKFEPISRSHEALVDVLQIGRNEEAGYFYYVMEIADAVGPESSTVGRDVLIAPRRAEESPRYQPKTLRSEQQRLHRLPVHECVNIGVTLASALAHLHKHGLVHRDVKPSNIIFVGGVPKLADIGLVADASEARSFVGTIGFIPPEGPGSPQADLYSLGKVLYETSTGKDRQDFPHLPPELLRGDHGASPAGDSCPSDERGTGREGKSDAAHLIELNEVLLRACHKDIRQRYASAEAMLADLELLQRGQSVQRKRTRERQLNFAKKLVTAVGVLTLATTAGIFLVKRELDTNRESHFRSSETANIEAGKSYQLGRFFFNKLTRESAVTAMQHFNNAIRLDTTFVAAYAGLVDCYLWNPAWNETEALPQIQALGKRILELDNARPEGHTAMAMHTWWASGKPSEAERQFRRAIDLNPNYAAAHHYLGTLLTSLGRYEEAQQPLKRAATLQPTWVNFQIALGYPFLAAHDFKSAAIEFEKARALEPDTKAAHNWLALAYEGQGEWLKALDHFEKAELLNGEDSIAVQKNYLAARQTTLASGATGYWNARITTVTAQKSPVSLWVAAAHARLGDETRALQWLQRAERETTVDMCLLRLIFVAGWEPMRDEPQFQELLRKYHLAETGSYGNSTAR